MSRYNQQLIVNEIGLLGQQKLSKAKVLIVGAGGLGTPVATYLAAMGVGEIGILDFDTIQESNLHRQFQYSVSDISLSKVEVLSKKLRDQNPTIQINELNVKLNSDNIESIIRTYEIICDCTDNATTRILIDKYCGRLSLPLVYAAVKEWEGYVTVLHGKSKISLSNIFTTEELLGTAESCSLAGIVSPVCGIIGSIQATEVIKLILSIPSELDGGLYYYNALTSQSRMLKLKS
ncbi:MAG: HesA/MoeB/ThiF family protein [Flexibacteraceae bacterium]